MVKRLSRKELYDLVWSEPMRILSARFGISDVAPKKSCTRAEIPTPDRGYRARKEAGKSAPQVVLPERPFGMEDELVVAGGASRWYQTWSDEDLLAPLPPPPEFHEPIEAARERIAKIIGKLSVARDIRYWHPAIDGLLKEDNKRRKKQLATPHPTSWDNPRFDTPFERRRLRILNTLFSTAARMNGKPTIDGREARSRMDWTSRACESFDLRSERVTLTCASGQNSDCYQIVTKTRAEEAKMEQMQKIEIRAILRLAKRFS